MDDLEAPKYRLLIWGFVVFTFKEQIYISSSVHSLNIYDASVFVRTMYDPDVDLGLCLSPFQLTIAEVV